SLIAYVGADVDGRRQRVVVGQLKRRAVGKHAGETPERRFADAQQIPLELDFGEPPAVRREWTTSRLDVALDVALLLLEMLGLQEQSCGPDPPIMRRHSLQIRRDCTANLSIWRSNLYPIGVARPTIAQQRLHRRALTYRTAAWAAERRRRRRIRGFGAASTALRTPARTLRRTIGGTSLPDP